MIFYDVNGSYGGLPHITTRDEIRIEVDNDSTPTPLNSPIDVKFVIINSPFLVLLRELFQNSDRQVQLKTAMQHFLVFFLNRSSNRLFFLKKGGGYGTQIEVKANEFVHGS